MKDKNSTNPLGSPDSLRKSTSTSGSSTQGAKSNGNGSDSKDDSNHTNQSKPSRDQCNPDADLGNSYLNLENIFGGEGGGDDNEEGSLDVRKPYFDSIILI